MNKFSLMGYSLGGKIALALTELFPQKIITLFLLAPDGIKINRWYNITSRSTLGKVIYNRIINKPQGFFLTILFLKRFGFITQKLHNFISQNMETKELRQLVFDIWRVFAVIDPNIKKLWQILPQHNIKTHLLFGKFDTIIRPKIGKRFAKQLPNHSEFHLIECGHILIREKTGVLLQTLIEHE